MQLFEMQGLLAGKCLPGDMKVNETHAEYFLRKFNQVNEIAAENSSLRLTIDNIVNTLKLGDGPVSQQVIELVTGLVAENAALKSYIVDKCYIIDPDNQHCMAEADVPAEHFMPKTPNTDAAIAEISAKAVEAEFNRTPDAEIKWDGTNLTVQNVRDGFSFGVLPTGRWIIVAKRRPIHESDVKEQIATEWNGEGLMPQVGMKCLAKQCSQINSDEFLVVAIQDDAVFGFWTATGAATGLDVNRWVFLPIRSAEEIARDNAIGALEKEWEQVTEKPAFKFEAIYDAIAAGKIPGIKLE